jgi:hypothetical protein
MEVSPQPIYIQTTVNFETRLLALICLSVPQFRGTLHNFMRISLLAIKPIDS